MPSGTRLADLLPNVVQVEDGLVSELSCLLSTRRADNSTSTGGGTAGATGSKELVLGSFVDRDEPYEWMSADFRAPAGVQVRVLLASLLPPCTRAAVDSGLPVALAFPLLRHPPEKRAGGAAGVRLLVSACVRVLS